MNFPTPPSAAVRRVIKDYLRRWWWVLALAALYHFLFLGIHIVGDARQPMVMVSIQAFFAGTALAMRDRSAGWLRLSSVLPLTTAERVEATRWTAILIPCLLWIVTGALTLGAAAIFGPGAERLRACAEVTCFFLLATPAAFLSQTIPPAMKPGTESLQWRLAPARTLAATLLMFLTMFGYQPLAGGSPAAPFIWLVLAAAAVAGWVRVRHWVTAPASGIDKTTRSPARGAIGCVGSHPLRNWLRETALTGGAIGAAMGLFYLALGAVHPALSSASSIPVQSTFAIFFAGMICAARLATAIRPLRAFPVPVRQLALFCTAVPVVAALSAALGGFLVHALSGRWSSVTPQHLQSWAACVCMLPLTGCALLRFSGSVPGYIVSIMLSVAPTVVLSMLSGEMGFSGRFALVALPALLIAWRWNVRLLTRSSVIYRAMQFVPRGA